MSADTNKARGAIVRPRVLRRPASGFNSPSTSAVQLSEFELRRGPDGQLVEAPRQPTLLEKLLLRSSGRGVAPVKRGRGRPPKVVGGAL